MIKEINKLIDMLEKKFPYSSMSSGFKGHHHIHRNDDGILLLGVWWNERAYRIPMETLNLSNLDSVFESVKQFIKAH